MDKVLACGALALAFAIPTASAAQDQMVVRGDEPAVQTWIADVGEKVGKRLDNPPMIMGRTPVGAAQVSFRRGSDGRPTDVRLTNKAGNPSFGPHAVRAIEGIKDLPPLPATRDPSTEIVANVVLAESQGHMGRLERKVMAWDAQRIAAGKGQRTVLAFAVKSSAYRPN